MNSKKSTMNKIQNILLITTLLMSVTSCKEDPVEQPSTLTDGLEGYSLIWSDEFNDGAVNLSNWVYETGDGTAYGLPAGWGNSELQLYTTQQENSGIETDGEISSLYLRATGDAAGGYSSAKLTTNKLFSMHFGRIDVKAKMPSGKGLWPAIWMLGDNKGQIDWPGCGEIDIVEILGDEPNKMYSTLHYTNSEKKHGQLQGSNTLSSGTYANAYHVYSLDWTPEALAFSIDGVAFQRMPIEADMKEFLRSFYLVMNVAVGGNWPGSPDENTTFPQSMNVDYVRVYSKDDFTAPDAPTLNIEEETLGQIIDPTIAANAIQDGFDGLGEAVVVVYGAGGEPAVSESDDAIDGDKSLVLDFPGGNWGGAYLELAGPKDMSSFTYLYFSLKPSTPIADAELKLESSSTDATVYLTDYTSTDVGQGFTEYRIPLADFDGLDLSQISIPFALWNPKDASSAFAVSTVLVDNLHFGN
jgi:beta-glucanase (GH16 family)